MGRFEFERSVPVSSMLGRWETSRAVNSSDGNDPVSLGLLPRGVDPGPEASPPPSLPQGSTPQQPLPPTGTTHDASPVGYPIPAEMGAYAGTMATDGHIPRLINLDTSMAILNNEMVSLSLSDVEKVMEILINAYERGLKDKLTSLRMEYLQQAPAPRETVWATDTERALVRPLQVRAEGAQSAQPGQPPPTDMQPLSKAVPPRRPRVQRVPRRKKGEGTTPPSA